WRSESPFTVGFRAYVGFWFHCSPNPNEFRAGIERIIEETPVPVIPMALQGLWGSFFSRDPNKGFFRRLWSRVSLVAGESVAPEAVERLDLQARVTSLRGEAR
ncbi:hypothetical protein ACR6FN_034960, partial [Pseudomonas aeruginosa]